MNWQRPFAVILLLLVLGSLGLAGFAAQAWLSAQNAATAESLSAYDRLRSIAAFDPAKLQSGHSDDAINANLLGEEPAPILSAKLQSALRNLAGQKSLVIGQASELQPSDLGSGLMKAGIRMEFSGQQQAVLEFFQLVDAQAPWLFADAVEIRSGSAYDTPETQEMPVTAVAEIWGIYRVPTEKAQAKAGATQP